MRRVFIHHEGALGDVLLSLRCISAIRARSPFVHLATRDDAGRLLERAGCVDAVSPSGSSLYVSLYTGERIVKGLRDLLRQFDEAFIFSTDRLSPVARSIGKDITRTKVIMTIPPPDVRMHVAEFRIRQIGVPIDSTAQSPLLVIPKEKEEHAREMLIRKGWDGLKPVITVHPGSGGGRKCWPLERYQELIGRMGGESDPYVVTLTGPAEDRETRRVMEAIAQRHQRAIHVADAELVDVAALIALSTVYVGNDSGITHLAGVVNGTVCALFGPTDPFLWRPPGHRVCIVTPRSGQSIASIPVEEVYRTIGMLLRSGGGCERDDAIGA